MRISIATRLGLGFVPAVAALLLAGWVFYQRLEDVAKGSAWVTHTLQVEQQLMTASAALSDAKSDAAAFMLSGRPVFKDSFDASAAKAMQAAERVRQLTGDNPTQQQNADKLLSRLRQRFDFLRHAMSVVRGDASTTAGQAPAEAVEDPLGAHTAQPVIDEMVAAERALLAERQSELDASVHNSILLIVLVVVGSLLMVTLLAGLTVNRIIAPLMRMEASARRVGSGDYAHRLDVDSNDEIGQVAQRFNQMVEQIEAREEAAAGETWVRAGLASLSDVYQESRDVSGLCHAVASRLAILLQAPRLALYLVHDADPPGSNGMARCGAFAAEDAPVEIALGQGLAGQCLAEGRPLHIGDLPPDYHARVSSALGEARPAELLLQPISFEGRVLAVLEIALLRPLDTIRQDLLTRAAEGMGLVLTSFKAREQTETALRTQTALTQALEQQRQALEAKNTELALQSEQLRASEALAREQQEELRLANEEQQQVNADLRELSHSLDLKAQQLAEVSAFKSEFLANMSHELRTPLNSLLILSKLLAEDQSTPLSPKQQQYARTIHESGNDLLNQINEILDMARIESGKMQVDVRSVAVDELVRRAESTFRHMAQNRHLDFHIEMAPDTPAHFVTDDTRVWQILKNLLANAFKFTSRGGVTLRIAPHLGAEGQAAGLSFAVKDSGIGIPPAKQARIFEAFQQADSGISRQYGGTGLGLSISLKLAALLGGSLHVESEEGQGSTFTLRLPLSAPQAAGDEHVQPPEAASRGVTAPAGALLHAAGSPSPGAFRTVAAPAMAAASPPATPESAAQAEQAAHAGEAAPAGHGTPATASAAGVGPQPPGPLLVATARDDVLAPLKALADRQGLPLLPTPGFAPLVDLAAQHRPVLVVMDAGTDAPGLWTALGHLKEDARTRHMAVHMLCHQSQKARALKLGAASFTLLPLESEQALRETIEPRLERLRQPQRHVLVVEDDTAQRGALLELLGNGDLFVRGVGTAAEALEVLDTAAMDCVVLDLGLPDMDGTALITEMNRRLGLRSPPVIVYTARDINQREETELMKGAQALIVKGANSPERLVDELTLLLSRWPSHLSPSTREMIDRSRQHDPLLAGRKALVVDDDVRNIFSISAALESHGMVVVHAESGPEGIAQLEQNPDVAVVLMDVMMPQMDGLEATRRIRAVEAWRGLPVIAVTAKAMPGDRDECLGAGASDYLSKPVDMDRLRAMIRGWLSQ